MDNDGLTVIMHGQTVSWAGKSTKGAKVFKDSPAVYEDIVKQHKTTHKGNILNDNKSKVQWSWMSSHAYCTTTTTTTTMTLTPSTAIRDRLSLQINVCPNGNRTSTTKHNTAKWPNERLPLPLPWCCDGKLAISKHHWPQALRYWQLW